MVNMRLHGSITSKSGIKALARLGCRVGILGNIRTQYIRIGSLFTAASNASRQTRTLLTQSYAQGPTAPALLTQTIPEHFSSIVKEHGDRLAIISRAQGPIGRLTYRELDERSTALAYGLRERGVQKGDRVAVSLGNNWEFATITYALFKLGAILVPLNPAFNSLQVIAALSHLEAAHLVIGAETNLAFKSPRENITLLEAIVPNLVASKIASASVPSLRNIIIVDNSSGRIDTSSLTATTPFQELMASQSSTKEVIPDTPLSKDEVVNIQFTSGTTSLPKAASLSHHSILNNGHQIGSRMGLIPTDIVCCPPPLFHCFGCILGYMATATHGSAILFPTEAFNPTATLKSIQAEKATTLYGVTTMFVAELELLSSGAISREGFEHLRTGIAAGSSVPSNLMAKLHKELNLTGLTICYGMTETAPVSFMTFPDDPLQKRLDSVGRLLPHVTAKITSTSSRSTILPIGERGELAVSGYNVMKGYWNDKIRTEEVRVLEDDGQVWMYTGDEAEMDADGYVKITGRIKDLIIRGGENIHPLEIENVLFKHDHISEVSVAGIPDERYGEAVAAFIVVHQNVKVGIDDAGNGDCEIDVKGLKTENSEKILTKEMVREFGVPKDGEWENSEV
ncbi:Acetyl-CoA synthetase-like protein [Glarea lozoyensis ATCC 20868]|uniref:Acetyl-CoA synthetase-like protein n=2 Tax=Glarea lozoyensis TaxID=101852 RepID=S3D984_GLAL2|nr:Acetyl-CoA synthetase-like protein [Glarea lozoyensis ATCC 20868]EPE35042.1 Acetyl-CoA synthetase-like protein [Glarea lozoyensis ATCC 20868]